MGCSESTDYKSSLQLSQDSTLDTYRISQIKPKPQQNYLDSEDFEDFDTSELSIEQTCFHLYDNLLKKVVTVPKLKSVTYSTILKRRNLKT
ncbi:unnamed protein product [Paramecium sonneborni]|uniref:Uncharacterized protein n=1 Tax=Paramecium sonneborni TaxID=65129 RepID=A0A8S1QWQ3_9CILI|nr:unnamed protein product [Paramecium sonneborni]